MEQRVIISEHQQATTGDANRFGQFPRESFDHLIEDIGPGFRYTGFASTITATTKVTVGSGRLYSAAGPVYFNADAGGTQLDFISVLPVVGKRICAIVASGQEIETQTEPRTFVIDAQTRETEARVTSTVSLRHASIQTVNGIEGPDPQRPLVPSNYLTFAWVTLNTEGVESIVMEEANRAKSIEDLEAAVGILDAWRILFGQRLEALATMIANLAARLGGLAPMDVLLRAIVDITRLKEEAGLPDTYSAWGSDYFLDEEESDTGNVDYLARIEEGIRFPHAAERVAALALNNPIDSTVILTDSTFMLPSYYEVRRLANIATAQVYAKRLPYFYSHRGTWYIDFDGDVQVKWHRAVAYRTIFVETAPKEVSISQFAYHTVSYRRRYPVRWRVRWGWPYYWSSRINYWWDRRHDPVWWAFRRISGDSAFIILPGPPFSPLPPPGRWTFAYKWHRRRWWWWDRCVDYHYWHRVITTHGLNGSMMAQTFLNDADGWLTGANIFFTRKGSTGDVTVLLCETNDAGQPNIDAVLAVSLPIGPQYINLWPHSTRVVFPPTLLQQGQRYALAFVTAGNHYLATTEKNQLTSGTLFYSTDQAWFQGFGDMSRDVAFELIFAEFENARAEVQLAPVELAGGIAAIDINVDSQVPEGTALTFEVQIGGNWVPINDLADDETDHPLVGLPALLNLRAVFQGSQSLMPSLSVGNASQVYTWRPRSDFTHISELRTPPAAIDTVLVTVRAEAWRGDAHHTLDVTVLTGKKVTAATVANGGTGGDYNVGDTITLANGVVLTVATESTTQVATVTVTNGGNVAIGASTPANPVGQVSSNGTGTGATFNLTWTDAEETHDSMVEDPAPEDNDEAGYYAIIRKYTFSGINPTITNYKVKMVGSTDNVLAAFHVAERVDISLDTP